MSLNEKLDNINVIKQNIKSAIENKGQSVTDFESYPDAISKIVSGSSSGVKLFETQEEMQADANAKEGDLAIVYRNEIQNMTADMEVTAITFPETVTLPAAFTDSTYCRLRTVDSSVMFDGNCDLNKTSFRFDGWSESGMIRVEYTSTDGITYTRTSFQGDNGDLTNPVELPITCKVEGEWNDNLGYFMRIGGGTFEGLFEYMINTIDDKSIRAAIINDSQIGEDIPATSTTNITYNYTTIEIDISVLNNMLSKFYNQYTPKYEYDIIYDVVTGNFKFYYSTAGGVYLAYYPSVSKWYLLASDKNETMHCIEYSVTNDTFNKIELHSVDNKNLVGDTGDYPCYSTDNLAIIATASSYNNTNSLTRKMVEMRMVTDISYRTFNSSPDYDNLVNKYKCASTQFTLKDSNELLPGKVAYGKNGVITGDESIYNNIDYTSIFKHYNGDLMKVSQNIYSDKRETGIPSYLKNIEYNKFGVTTSRFISKTSYEGLANANISGEFIYDTTNYTILNWNEDVLVYDKSGNLIHHQTLTGLGTEYINISIIDRGEKVYLINLYTKARFDISPSGIESKTTPVSVSGTWNKVWDVGNDDLLLFPEAAKLSKYSLINNTVQVIRQESSGGGKNTGGVTFDNDYVYCGQVNNRIYVLNRTDLTYVGMTDNYYNVFSNRNNCYAYDTRTKFIYTIHGMDLVKIAECKSINASYILYYDPEHSRAIYPNWLHTRAYDNNSGNQYRLGNISDIDVHMKCQNYNENLGKIIGYGVEDNGDFYEYETTFDKIIDGENTNDSIPLVILDNTHNVGHPYTIYKAIMRGVRYYHSRAIQSSSNHCILGGVVYE